MASFDQALQQFVNFVSSLKSGELEKAQSRAAITLAHRVKDMVAARYRELSKPPKGIGKLALQMGKAEGAIVPARMPRSASSSMTMFANSIVVTKLEGGYRIQVNPSLMHPDVHGINRGQQGVRFIPLAQIADYIERAVPSSWPITLRMMGYLASLRRGTAGPGKPGVANPRGTHMPDRKVGGTMVFTPPERPVWKKVAEDIASLQSLYTKDLWKRLRGLALQFGLR